MPSVKRRASTIEAAQPPSKKAGRTEDDVTAGMLEAAMGDDMWSNGSGASDGEDDEDLDMDENDEDGEDVGFEDLEDQDKPQGNEKSKGKGKKSLYAPATSEEMRMLKSSEGRGAGFAFGMKIEALLSSTFLQPTPSPPSPALTSLLTSIHTKILSLPTLASLPTSSASQRLNPTTIPFPSPHPLQAGHPEPNWKLGWEKPAEIFVGGSWPVFGGYKKGKGKGKEMEASAIDLVVLMPESMFSAKDRTGNRYFHKRAHYLAVIAASMAAGVSGWEGVQVGWEFQSGDFRIPVVTLKFGKNKEKGLKYAQTIRILAGVSQDVFPISTLFPSKSNIRLASSSDDDVRSPTPAYNHSLLLTLTPRSHLLYLHGLAKSCRSFRAALALWRIWSARRGLEALAGGVLGGMVLGMVVDGGFTVTRGKEGGVRKVRKGLGRGLSEWQLLKGGWEFLASTDFGKTAMFLNTPASAATIPMNEFLNAYQDIFVDPTGTINLFAGWAKGELDLLRHEAKATLEMLAVSTAERDRFDEVFLRDMRSGAGRFDEVLTVDVTDARISGESPLQAIEQPDVSKRIASKIADVVRHGLGTRASLVVVRPISEARSWAVSSAPPTSSTQTLEIDLLLDKTEQGRVLDQGPPAEQAEEAAAFRAFWGDKAELRRFKDGSITESVVWDAARPEDRALVPGHVVSWVIKKHLGIDKEAVDWQAPKYVPLLQVPKEAHRLVYKEASEKLGFRPALEAFEALYKVLKGADDKLPLSILNFTPNSEYLRYTSTFVPHPVDLVRAAAAPECVRHLPAIDVVVQFESSRKWPDDLVAMQKIKLAFFENLARLIQDNMDDARVSVVLELGAPDIQDHAVLEVLVKEGFAFHIRIYHDRERTLLQRMVEDPDLSSEQLRKIAFDSYHLHVLRFSTKPRHHAAVATLHHLFPSYATATRLLKRWFASHMLSEHVPKEMIELIAADSYLDPGSFGVPCSGVAGFHRALARLANWNWKEEAIMVSLYTITAGGRDVELGSAHVTFPSDLRSKAIASFNERRKADPECLKSALVVCSEEDVDGKAWDVAVGRVIAGRIVTLAAACVARPESVPLTFFQTSMADYDFLIELKPEVVARLAQSIAKDNDNAAHWTKHVRGVANGSAQGQETVLVDFDPALSFYRDLVRLYGSNILFFFDPLGGSTIGALWNPSTLPTRNFKPFLGFPSRPVGEASNLVELDKAGIIEEVKRLGEGLVLKVQQNR